MFWVFNTLNLNLVVPPPPLCLPCSLSPFQDTKQSMKTFSSSQFLTNAKQTSPQMFYMIWQRWNRDSGLFQSLYVSQPAVNHFAFSTNFFCGSYVYKFCLRLPCHNLPSVVQAHKLVLRLNNKFMKVYTKRPQTKEKVSCRNLQYWKDFKKTLAGTSGSSRWLHHQSY